MHLDAFASKAGRGGKGAGGPCFRCRECVIRSRTARRTRMAWRGTRATSVVKRGVLAATTAPKRAAASQIARAVRGKGSFGNSSQKGKGVAMREGKGQCGGAPCRPRRHLIVVDSPHYAT